MVNVTFIRKSALDIRKMLQRLDEVLVMNSSQLVDIGFTVYHVQETRKLKLATIFFLETGKREDRFNPKKRGKTH